MIFTLKINEPMGSYAYNFDDITSAKEYGNKLMFEDEMKDFKAIKDIELVIAGQVLERSKVYNSWRVVK